MNRDSFFDNYRGLLIILVVVGHFLNPLTDESHFMNFIVTSIYSFHMPAFVFISAYFGKHNDLRRLIKRFLLPYFVFQLIYNLLLNTLWGQNSPLELLVPEFSLWFLLSLFCWRAIVDKLIRIRWILPASFILGILVAFDTSIGALGSLGRTVAFLPYFLLGYTFNREKFMSFARRPIVKVISVIALLMIFTFFYFTCEYIEFDLLTLKFSYKKIGLPEWGWIYRLTLYAISTPLIYLIAVLIPRTRHWFTYLGQRTMPIYLLHGLVFKSIYYMTLVYSHIDTKPEYLLTILFAVALTFLLSVKPLTIMLHKLTELPVERLLIDNNSKDRN